MLPARSLFQIISGRFSRATMRFTSVAQPDPTNTFSPTALFCRTEVSQNLSMTNRAGNIWRKNSRVTARTTVRRRRAEDVNGDFTGANGSRENKRITANCDTLGRFTPRLHCRPVFHICAFVYAICDRNCFSENFDLSIVPCLDT